MIRTIPALDEAIAPLARFNLGDLARHNEAIEAGAMPIDALVRAVRGLADLEGLRATLLAMSADRERARGLLQELGFVASSVERHVQAKAVAEHGPDALAAARGQGVALLPGLDPLLGELGRIGQHTPRDSYHTYWQLNEGHRRSFTQNRGEAYFNRAVNATNRLFGAASEALRRLQTGEIAPDRPAAEEAMAAATAAVKELIELYKGFMTKDASGERQLEPAFFMKRMRAYIAPYPVGGVEQEGPNATYSPGWPLMDFAFGLRAPAYREMVAKRYPWMLPEHRAELDQALAVPSLAVRMLDWLGLDAKVVPSLSEELILTAAERQGPRILALGLEYGRLVGAHRQLSGTHLSLINNQLTKPAAALTPAERERIVPQPTGGVGGNPLEETVQINDGRSKDPVNAALERAFRARSRGA